MARTIRIVTSLAVIAGLIALAAAWAYPKYRDMARRSLVGRILWAAEDVRKEIGYRVDEKKTLAGVGKGLSIKPDGNLTSATVSDDGVIVLSGTVDGYPVVIALKPYLKGSELGWRCGALKAIEGWFMPDDGYLPRGCPRAASLDSF